MFPTVFSKSFCTTPLLHARKECWPLTQCFPERTHLHQLFSLFHSRQLPRNTTIKNLTFLVHQVATFSSKLSSIQNHSASKLNSLPFTSATKLGHQWQHSWSIIHLLQAYHITRTPMCTTWPEAIGHRTYFTHRKSWPPSGIQHHRGKETP